MHLRINYFYRQWPHFLLRTSWYYSLRTNPLNVALKKKGAVMWSLPLFSGDPAIPKAT
jgi:hypothetical protein